MNLPFVISNVLAPADLTDSDLPALRFARHVADRFAAKLTVAYSDPIYPPDFVPRSEVILPPPTAEQRARMRVDVERHVAPVMKRHPYEIYLTIGHPITAILAASRKLGSDLIVLGTHMRHGWRRALIGSVSEGVLKGSRIAVLTVAAGDHGASDEPQVKKIICPVNFTAVSRDALHAAERVAQRFRAELVIVHVNEPDAIADPIADEDHVRRWIAPEMQNVCEFREVVVRGDAAQRVLDCAEDVRADLLVIGAQHKRFRDTTVIGTTAENLVRFSPCPVLVVPHEALQVEETIEAEPEIVLAER